MSRTPLIDLLRRAYRASQISLKTDIPPSEVQEMLSEQVSRRRVLQAGMTLTGILGVNPGALPRSSQLWSADSKVLVVGAGIAGLTAAYRLRQAGVPVDVIEATQRVGGRLVSLNDIPGTPSTVELGGEFIDTRHTHVLALVKELGLEVADLKAADTGLEPEILYFQGNKISHDRIIAEFAPLAQRIAQDLKRLGRNVTYHSPSPNAVQLDRLSLAEYLDTVPMAPVVNQLIRVAYITEYGQDAETQSCLNMLFLIGAEVGQWSTYGISDERWHVVGGNDQIPRRLAERLEGAIATGTVLESIRTGADGRYRVGLRKDATSIERPYERILLTVPFGVLRQVELAVEMSPVKREAIAQLGYGTNTKLVTPYQERIWKTRYSSTVSIYTDMDFQNTWESARYSQETSGWVTDLRGGNQGVLLGSGSPETHAQALTDSLEPIFPGISQVRRGQAVRAAWATEPYALGSYSCYLPGQWTRFAGAEAERVGNLWFAGEHCSAGSQGYMDGACETAEVAALNLLQDLGVRRA